MKILWLEDHPEQGPEYKAVLEKAGFEVHWVHTGKEVEDALKAPGASYDVLLLDQNLTKSNSPGGEVVVRGLATRELLPKGLRIVYFTGLSQQALDPTITSLQNLAAGHVNIARKVLSKVGKKDEMGKIPARLQAILRDPSNFP